MLIVIYHSDSAQRISFVVLALTILLHFVFTGVFVTETRAEDIMTAQAEHSAPQGDFENGDAVSKIEQPLNTHSQSSENIKYVERAEEDLLIVALLTGKALLDPGIIIYSDEEDLLLPLSVFTELLQFPIDVDPSTGVAQGWFLKQENTFTLRPPYNKVTIKGVDQAVKGGVVENHIDDIYVSKALIESWFPINLTLNFNELRLYLETSEDLPFEKLAKRQARWEAVRSQTGNRVGTEIGEDVIRLPYKKFMPPVVQINESATISEASDKKVSNTTHSIQLQGDLVGMNMRAGLGYATTTDGENDFQSATFTLSKEDFEGKIGDKLQATRLEIGDVTAKSIPLSGGQQRGRGITFDNTPINFVRNPNEFIIDGFAPVGWDVEVYQDERLLDFQTVDQEGRYSFDALPLRQGFNLFRIVIYGTNGEEEVRSERFYLGRNMVEPGKFLYDFSALQSSTKLFDFSKTRASETPHTLSLFGEYGINKNLSSSIGYFRGPLGQGVVDGIGGGLRMSSTRTFAQANYFRDKSGAYSGLFDFKGNLSKNLSWSLLHERHSGYEEGMHTTSQKSEASLFQNFSLKLFPRGSYTLKYKDELFESGTSQQTVTNLLSGVFLGMNLTNELRYIIRSNTDDKEVLGTLTVRKRLPWGNMRARMNYRLKEVEEIENIEIQFQNQLAKNIFLTSVLNQTLGDDKETLLSNNISIQLDKVKLGFNSSLSDQGDKRVGVNLAYNFVPQNLQGDYKLTGSGGELNSGRVIIEPFLDKNQNNIKDGDDEILEGVVFKNRLRGSKAVSNAQGQAILPSLSPNLVNSIYADLKTLPDIYMAPTQETIKILGKLGINGPVPYPVHQLGEISGQLKTRDPNTLEIIELADVRILLIDEHGEEVAETYTEYDGFYFFPSLPMGTYEMFFPKAHALDAYYIGQGMGPTFSLGMDNSELLEVDIMVLPEEILFEKEVTEEKLRDAQVKQNQYVEPEKDEHGFYKSLIR